LHEGPSTLDSQHLPEYEDVQKKLTGIIVEQLEIVFTSMSKGSGYDLGFFWTLRGLLAVIDKRLRDFGRRFRVEHLLAV